MPHGLLQLNLATRNILEVTDKKDISEFVTTHKKELQNKFYQALLRGIVPKINFTLEVNKYSLDTKKNIGAILSDIQGLHFSYSDLPKK